MRAHIAALACCLFVATSITNVALASPTIGPWAPRDVTILKTEASALYKRATDAMKADVNADYAYDISASYDSLRADFIKRLPDMAPEDASNLLETFASLNAPILYFVVTHQTFQEWDFKALVKKTQIQIPGAIFGKMLKVAELPKTVWVTGFTPAGDVIVSPNPSLVFSVAMRQLAFHLGDKNYERLIVCLSGFSYATKYTDAFLHSQGAAQVDLKLKLMNFSDRPFCMNESFTDLVAEMAGANVWDARNKIARMILLNSVPSVNSLLPVGLYNSMDKSIRIGNETHELQKTWVYLSIAPEQIGDRQKDDPIYVMSSQDVKNLAATLSGIDVTSLPAESAFMTTFDAQLLSDVKDLFTTRQNDKELGRRLRVGQLSHLRQNLEPKMRSFYMDPATDITNTAFSRFLPLLTESLNSALLDTFDDLFADQVVQRKIDLLKIKAIADHSVERWLKRAQGSGQLNNWINIAAARVAQNASQTAILTAESKEFINVLREAAQKLNATAGDQIPDEKLEYDPTLALNMMYGEIKKSSARVQKWFDYLFTATSYELVEKYQAEVEAHIRKSLTRPEICDLQPIKFLDKVAVGWNVFSQSALFGFGQVDKGTLTPDELDCQRFVRLTTFANVRGMKSKPKDMSESVQALDKYWSRENRDDSLSLYRKLLRIKGLDAHRILDIAVSDSKTLEQVLLRSDGSTEALNAIGKTMDNIETNMKDLLNAKSLDDLAPLIVRSSFLDQSFAGMNELLRTQTNNDLDLATMMSGISELMKQHKFVELTDFKKEIDPGNDHFISLTRFHSIMKEKYRVAVEVDQTKWKAVYKDSLDSIYPMIGLLALRRLAFWKAPDFAGSKVLFDYMAYNRQLAQGYFSALTIPFAGDGIYAYFYGIRGTLEENQKFDDRQAHSELKAIGPQFMDARTSLSNNLENTAARETYESSIKWAVAMTAVPLAPTIARLGSKTIDSLMAHFWEGRAKQFMLMDAEKAEIVKLNPNAITKMDRTINTIAVKRAYKLERFMSYNRASIQFFKLDMRGDPLEVLRLDNVKKAYEEYVAAATTSEQKAQALAEYRKILKGLYDEMGSFYHMQFMIEKVYSQVYGGIGEFDYIKRVVEEYHRVVLGL